MLPKLTTFAAASVIAFVLAGAANAAVVINVTQAGADVALTATGTFDETKASLFAVGTLNTTVDPYGGKVAFGSAGPINFYNASGPHYFGLVSGNTAVTDNSGLGIGVYGYPDFYISSAYVNNSEIVSAGFVRNATLSSLNLTSGVYNYTVGQNAVTVNIGQPLIAAVPEPATWAMMILGMGAIGFALRRRQKVRTTVQFA